MSVCPSSIAFFTQPTIFWFSLSPQFFTRPIRRMGRVYKLNWTMCVCVTVITPTFPLKTLLNQFQCFTEPHNHTYSESSWHILSPDAPVMTMKKTHAKTKTKTKTELSRRKSSCIYKFTYSVTNIYRQIGIWHYIWQRQRQRQRQSD